MKNLKSLLAAACALFAIASCQKPEPEVPAQLSVTPAKLTLSATLPARATLKVSCDKAWTVSTEADWLTLSCEGGEGNGEVVVNASLNAGPDGQSAPLRSAPVVFSATGTNFEVNVTQKGEDIVFVADGSAELSADGGKVLVSVRHNVSYSVEIPAEASWITQDATKAVVTDNLSFTVAQNSSVVKREALIALRPSEGDAQVIKVSQAGIPLVFKVDPTEYTASEMGETVEVSVEHNCAYTVNIPSDVTWVTKGSIVEGNTDKVSLVVAANDGDNRETVISFVSEEGTSIDLKLSQWAQGSLKEIANLDDWKKFVEVAETIPAERVITITADLDFSGYTHAAIPSFSGTLDGQGHKIMNWAISGDQPLVKTLKGTVKDLVIDKSCTFAFADAVDNSIICLSCSSGSYIINCVSDVDVDFEGDHQNVRFGSMASYGGGFLRGCVNNGNIRIVVNTYTDNGFNYVGGLLGYYSTPKAVEEENPNLKDCVNNGSVLLRFNSKPSRGGLGGVVGASATKKIHEITDKGWVVDCINNGPVTYVANYTGNGAFNLGGVIGYAEGHIKGCKNYGKVFYDSATGKTSPVARPAVGGVIGCCTYTVDNCHNEGEIVVNGTMGSAEGITDVSTGSSQACGRWHGPSVGGVVATVGNQNKSADDGWVKNCTNKGAIVMDVDMITTNGTELCVGGVCGYSNKPLEGDVNDGSINVTSLISGNRVSGVLGYADDSFANVTNCKNHGDIVLKNTLTEANGNQGRYIWSGCIVGDNYSSSSSKAGAITIMDCENTGDFTIVGGYMQASYNYLGGILGRGYFGTPKLINCRNSGKLSSESALKFRAGGLAGQATCVEATNCHNTGDIVFPNAFTNAGVGGLFGHGSPKAVTACSTSGKVDISNAYEGAYAGMAVGTIANTVQTWNDVTVAGALTAKAGTKYGILVGGQIDLSAGASPDVVIGSSKPVVVASGTTVNGVTVTASDVQDKTKLIGFLIEGFETAFRLGDSGVILK